MLPQAFGPFTDAGVADASKRLFEFADQIWARDSQSLDHLESLLGHDPRVGKAPDITIALGVPRQDAVSARVAVVPNVNISSRAAVPDATERYVDALGGMVRLLRRDGLDPVLLVHSKPGDLDIANRVRSLGENVDIVIPSNGVDAKVFIGQCAGLIAARYHAVVSALSQGVPVIAHSWSHKYEELLAEFGMSSSMASPFDAEQSVGALTSQMADSTLGARVAERQLLLARDVDAMWTSVEELLVGRGVLG